MKNQVLLLVHPGSCCGSASMNLGKLAARDARTGIVRALDAWVGDVLVMDGELSDELEDYPELNDAIHRLMARAPRAERTFACDNLGEHFTRKLPKIIRRSHWSDVTAHAFTLTGPWFHEDDTAGCVNAARDVFVRMGFDVRVCRSAITFPDSEDQECVEGPSWPAVDLFMHPGP